MTQRVRGMVCGVAMMALVGGAVPLRAQGWFSGTPAEVCRAHYRWNVEQAYIAYEWSDKGFWASWALQVALYDAEGQLFLCGCGSSSS
jgi:hypothetical protein